MPNSLTDLEKIIDYEFANDELLKKALTHRSWSNENHNKSDRLDRREQNERLEFVGDSVLGLTIAEKLYQEYPNLDEGDLTLMKHHLVSMETLAKVASEINLGVFMLIGRGEEKTGGRKKQAILADTLEAVIGAVFFDGSYRSAKNLILDLFSEEIRVVSPNSSLDYKTLLQETLQGEKLEAPSYQVVKTEGPPHNRLFTVEASWNNGSATGQGNSKKAAETEAARKAIKLLRNEDVKTIS